MNCKITLTANAGVIFQSDICFMLDALHNIKSELFPSLSPEMTEAVFALTDRTPPDAMLVTHEHKDHYSAALISRAVKSYPQAALINPAAIHAGHGKYKGSGYTVEWFPLPHAKLRGFEAVSNYGFLVEFNGRSVFTAGDASPTAEETAGLTHALRPDVALLNFTWVCRRANREVLERMEPKHIVLFHLPFYEHDPYGYIPATTLAVKDYCPRAVILNSFLQTAQLDI